MRSVSSRTLWFRCNTDFTLPWKESVAIRLGPCVDDSLLQTVRDQRDVCFNDVVILRLLKLGKSRDVGDVIIRKGKRQLFAMHV